MITNYNKYKIKDINEFKFKFKFDIISILNDTCKLEYNIFINYSNNRFLIDELYKSIKIFINDLFNNRDSYNHRYFLLSIEECIYFILKLKSLNWIENDHVQSLYVMFKTNRYNFNVSFKKELTLDIFKKELSISFKEKDIDDFYISQIENDINLYNDPLYQYIISDNVKKHFKYLDNSKNFDLI